MYVHGGREVSDYAAPDSYPPLAPQQVAKLKHLTLVSLALEHRVCLKVPYLS